MLHSLVCFAVLLLNDCHTKDLQVNVCKSDGNYLAEQGFTSQ
jgi:hypothetical protein